MSILLFSLQTKLPSPDMQVVRLLNPPILLNSNLLLLVFSNSQSNRSINGLLGYPILNSNSKLHSTLYKKRVSNFNLNSNTIVLKIKLISLKIVDKMESKSLSKNSNHLFLKITKSNSHKNPKLKNQ